MWKVLAQHPSLLLAEKVPSIAPELSQIVATCLKRDPDDRWNTTAELARALVPYGTGTWKTLLQRIDRVLSRSAPQRKQRFVYPMN